MRKRSELIRQIHAMETVPIIRANFLDLTETAGLGLLSEMSLVEVWECGGIALLSLKTITSQHSLATKPPPLELSALAGV